MGVMPPRASERTCVVEKEDNVEEAVRKAGGTGTVTWHWKGVLTPLSARQSFDVDVQAHTGSP
jgi:hypothetical protein